MDDQDNGGKRKPWKIWKNWKETAKDRITCIDLAEKAKTLQRVVVPDDDIFKVWASPNWKHLGINYSEEVYKHYAILRGA